jgi:hypothetical protein
MARRPWPIRAPMGRSVGAGHRGCALAGAAVALTCLLPWLAATSPARAAEAQERFSFTGAFRYKSLPASGLSALHLPPEAVPIPVRSPNRRGAAAPTPLPDVVPRALLGAKSRPDGKPFATDHRSTLGAPDPETRERTTPATRAEQPAGERGPDGTSSRGDQSAARRNANEPGSSGPLTKANATRSVPRSRNRAARPSPPRRQRMAGRAETALPAPKSNTLLAPTPPWAVRAFGVD